MGLLKEQEVKSHDFGSRLGGKDGPFDKLTNVPVMSSDIDDALMSAGAEEAKAKAAAEEIAPFGRRLNRIEVLLGIVVALQIATFGAVFFK